MEALRWHGAADVRLDQVARPDAARQGLAIVAVRFCGICGTDLAEYRDGPKLIRNDAHPLTGQAPPITLGHEFAGRVLSSSDPVRWPTGTRVTADACWRCGECEACREGAYNRCRFGGSIGLHSDGAFAERVAVPEYCLVALPDAVSDEQGALAEPLAVGLHALDRAASRPGEHVLVLGFGPIGAASALLARSLGARVQVVEVEPARRARAEALGFASIDAGDGLPRRVRRSSGGGADVVVETTGSAALLPDAVECARRGGRIALAGITTAPTAIDTSRIVLFERSLIGSFGYQNDIQRVVRMMEAGLVDPSGMISEIVSLSDAAHTIKSLAENPDGRIKVLVETGGEASPAVS